MHRAYRPATESDVHSRLHDENPSARTRVCTTRRSERSERAEEEREASASTRPEAKRRGKCLSKCLRCTRRGAAAALPERRRHSRRGRRDGRDPLVRRPERRARIGLAPVGPVGHRALGLGGDRQRRVDPEVGRDRRAVDDVEARMAVYPLVGVDHPRRRRGADGAAADEVRGQRPSRRARRSSRLVCRPSRAPSGARPRCRPGSRSGWARRGPAST